MHFTEEYGKYSTCRYYLLLFVAQCRMHRNNGHLHACMQPSLPYRVFSFSFSFSFLFEKEKEKELGKGNK